MKSHFPMETFFEQVNKISSKEEKSTETFRVTNTNWGAVAVTTSIRFVFQTSEHVASAK